MPTINLTDDDFERVDREEDERRVRDAAILRPAVAGEQVGAAVRIAKQRGLPPAVVVDNLADYQQQDADDALVALGREDPAAARWLANPLNQPVAREDFVALGLIGKAARKVNALYDDVFSSNAYQRLEVSALKMFADLTASGAEALESTDVMSLLANAGKRASEARGDADDVARWTAFGRRFGVGYEDVAAEARGMSGELGGVRESLAGETTRPDSFAAMLRNPGQAGRYYLGMGADSLPAILLAMGTRSATGAVAATGATTGAGEYVDQRNEGKGKLEALKLAAPQAGLEAGFSVAPFGAAFSRGAGRFWRVPALEAATEAATTAAQTAVSDVQGGTRTPMREVLLQMRDAAIVGGGLGAGEAVLGGAPEPSTEVVKKWASSVKAAASKQYLDGLMAAVAKSKTRSVSPAQFEDLMREQVGDAMVYVPAANLSMLFQSEGLDPAEATAQLLGDENALAEALAVGTPVAIPMARYAAYLADAHAELSDVVRIAPDVTADDTPVMPTREQIAADIAEALAAGEQIDNEAARGGALFQDIYGQLRAAGVEDGAAAKQALVVQTVFSTWEQRLGLEPGGLAQRYAFNVNRPEPAPGMGAPRDVDVILDPLIEQVRAERARGKDGSDLGLPKFSIIQAVIDAGGLRPDAVGAGDVRNIQRPGLFNNAGLTVEAMAQSLADGGYGDLFATKDEFGRPDYRELLEMLADESTGAREFRLPDSEQTPSMLAAERNLEQLGEMRGLIGRLESEGFDVDAMPVAELRALVEGLLNTEDGEGGTFYQDALPDDATVEQLRARIAELERELRTDHLTGLRNRRAFDEDAALGWGGVMAFDLDGLTALNTLGHEVGDAALRAVAAVMLDSQTDTARFYHTSGDEFFGRAATLEDAQRLAQVIQDKLESVDLHLDVAGPDGVVRYVTYQGLGVSRGAGATPNEADQQAVANKSEREAAGVRAPKGGPGSLRRLVDRRAEGSDRREGGRGEPSAEPAASRDGLTGPVLPFERMADAPVGAWVQGPSVPGVDDNLFQIREVPLDLLELPEVAPDGTIPSGGKMADVERYAERMLAGDTFPNARGYELPNGRVKLADGHRRAVAARAAGLATLRVAVRSDAPPAQQTNTPEFRRWFGDSKVVEADGAPLVVHHRGTFSGGAFNVPAFFTEDRDAAESYPSRMEEEGVTLTSAYLSIQNPASDADIHRAAKDVIAREPGAFPYTAEEIDEGMVPAFEFISPNLQDGAEDVVALLRLRGFDGARLSVDFTADGDRMTKSWAVFDSTQVKSVDNVGTFDPANPNVLFQSPDPFYSALARAVEEGKGAPKKGDAAAWKGWLDGAQRRGEFKPGEREWMGLDAWLDKQGTVTREQLRDFVSANQLQVSEVLLGGNTPPPALLGALDQLRVVLAENPDAAAQVDAMAEDVRLAEVSLLGAIEDAGFPAIFDGGPMEVLESLQNEPPTERDDRLGSARARTMWREYSAIYDRYQAAQDNLENGGGAAFLVYDGEKLVGSFANQTRAMQAVTRIATERAASGGFRLPPMPGGIWLGIDTYENTPEVGEAFRFALIDSDEEVVADMGTLPLGQALNAAIPMLEEVGMPSDGWTAGDAPYSSMVMRDPASPSGKDYRVLLLRLPNNKTFDQRLREWAAANGKDPARYEVEVEYTMDTGDSRRLSADYRSGHFPQENIVAHVRFDERTSVDGKRVLFINELQSDWHQAGRRRGYRGQRRAKYPAVDQMAAEVGWQVRPATQAEKAALGLNEAVEFHHVTYPDGSTSLYREVEENLRNEWRRSKMDRFYNGQGRMPDAEWDELSRLVQDLQIDDNAGDQVPDAPLKTTWPELVLKRMVRYAAENGFDAVSWPTAEQVPQIEQWGYTLEQIRSDPRRSKQFGAILDRYETDLPRIAKALGKKHGAKVIDVEIGAPSAEQLQADADFVGDGVTLVWPAAPAARPPEMREMGDEEVEARTDVAFMDGFDIPFGRGAGQTVFGYGITQMVAAGVTTDVHVVVQTTGVSIAWPNGNISTALWPDMGAGMDLEPRNLSAAIDQFEFAWRQGRLWPAMRDDSEMEELDGPPSRFLARDPAEDAAARDEAVAELYTWPRDGIETAPVLTAFGPGERDAFGGAEDFSNGDAPLYGTVQMAGAGGDGLEWIVVVADNGITLMDPESGEPYQARWAEAGLGTPWTGEQAAALFRAAWGMGALWDALDRGRGTGPRLATSAEVAAAAMDEAVETPVTNPALEITPSLRDAALAGLPVFQGGVQPRGGITGAGGASVIGDQPGPDGKRVFNISLFAGMDYSTFLHENGHAFLEIFGDLAAAPDAPEQIRADYGKVLAWLGVPDRAGIQRAQHEKFARGWEAYLREGRAPSSALRRAFAAFGVWLRQVYRSALQLNVELNDDVRGVFDRMLATDAEIAAARADAGQVADPALLDGIPGITPEEVAAWREAAQAAQDDAEQALAAEVLREQQRAARAFLSAERRKVRAEVEAATRALRPYRALRWLRQGKLPDGSPVPTPMRISRQSLLDAGFLPAFIRTHLSGTYARAGGLPLDQVASLLGYGSGQEMVAEITAAPPLAEAVKADTDRIMAERYPDPLVDGSIADRALAAVHREKQGAAMLLAVQALERSVDGRVRSQRHVVAQIARDLIARKRARDVQPVTYLRAEQKAGREALEAAAAGNWKEAAAAARRQLLAHHLWREARDARAGVDKAQARLLKLTKTPARAKLGKAGGTYLEQIDALLERFELKPLSGTAADRRTSLAAWVKAQEAAGYTVDLPDSILEESQRIPFRNLTVQQVRDLDEAVAHIAALARLKNKLLAAADKRDFEEVVTELAESIAANHGEPSGRIDLSTSFKKRFGDWLERADAWLVKPEFVFTWLDGERANGPVWRTLFQPFVDAEGEEKRLNRQVTTRLREILAPYGRGKLAMERVHVPGAVSARFAGNFTREALLVVGLNMGNDYNRTAMMEGFGWTEQHLQAAAQALTDQDWQVVQQIFDLYETLRPAAFALHRDVTGLEPEQVQATPFVTPTGRQMRGGYHPLRADSTFSFRAFKRDEEASVLEQYGGNFAKAATRKGHLKERTNFGGQPVKLSLSVVSEHLTNVIHDVTHRRAVMDVQRLLNAGPVREAIESAAGRQVYRQLHPWLVRIASDTAPETNPLMDLVRRARVGATVVNMGLKVTTAIVQPLGLLQTVEVIGQRAMASGLLRFAQNPQASINFAMTRSQVLPDRMQSYDRDVRDSLSRVTSGGLRDDVQRSFFILTGLMDMGVVIPSWLGAYHKAMAGGVPGVDPAREAEAIAYADGVVRQSQSSGSIKDLAAIQTGNEVFRLFTMFYSYFSVLYSLGRRAIRRTRSTRDLPRLAASAFYLWFVPAVLGELIAGRGPDDEDDDPDNDTMLDWLAGSGMKSLLTYPFQTVPVVRDVINGLGSYRYSPSPAFDAFALASGTVKVAWKAGKVGLSKVTGRPTDEEIKRSEIKSAFLAAGYWGKFPARQMWITGSYVYDLAVGNEQPDNVGDVLSGLAFARPGSDSEK